MKKMMKKPMKKSMGKRTRRFGAGGETNPDENAAGSQVEFSPEQEEWLGGADRTDPYILARMRKAVPDKETSTISPRLPVAPAKTEAEPVYKENLVGNETKESLDPYNAASKKPVSISTPVKKPAVKPAPKVEAKPAPITNKDVDRLREIDKGLEKVTPEEYLMPGGALKGAAALSSRLIAKQAAKAGDKAFNAARDITPGVRQIGKDVEKIGLDKKQLTYNPRKLGYNKSKDSSSGSRNTSTSSEFKKGADDQLYPFKKGGSVKKMASGGRVKSASARADGCAIRGKTRA
jgi:hypothetical protein